MNSNSDKNQVKDDVTLWQTVVSVLAAGFGVQSEKNRERDFQQGSMKAFIVIGVVFTVVLVLFVMGLVKLALLSLS